MFAACVLAALMSTPGVPKPASVALRPLGEVDRSTLERVAKSLRSTLGLRVEILEARPLPRSAYYVPRARYRAEGILSDLEKTTPAGFSHVLGVTARDISAKKGEVADWGVFGVARLGGRPGVVSTYRLRAGGVPPEVFLARLARVAAHELGHALGLRHCDAVGCLMNNAEGHIRSVDAATGFCARCRGRLDALAEEESATACASP